MKLKIVIIGILVLVLLPSCEDDFFQEMGLVTEEAKKQESKDFEKGIELREDHSETIDIPGTNNLKIQVLLVSGDSIDLKKDSMAIESKVEVSEKIKTKEPEDLEGYDLDPNYEDFEIYYSKENGIEY